MENTCSFYKDREVLVFSSCLSPLWLCSLMFNRGGFLQLTHQWMSSVREEVVVLLVRNI